jgi:Acyl-CoA carboxylase epsilon subunit
MTGPGDHDQPPVLAIVAGDPSAEQIAAVVAVLSAQTGRPDRGGGGETARSGWSARSRLLRAPTARNPGGWRASALPR